MEFCKHTKKAICEFVFVLVFLLVLIPMVVNSVYDRYES